MVEGKACLPERLKEGQQYNPWKKKGVLKKLVDEQMRDFTYKHNMINQIFG